MYVKVYSTPTCPYCGMVRKYLDVKKVPYECFDVSRDVSAAEEMVNKSGQRSVPVVDFDGSIIIGFDKDAIDKLL